MNISVNFLLFIFLSFLIIIVLLLQKVKEMWEIIKTMSNIPALVRDEDPLKARGNSTIQQCLIAQGKKYLEKRFDAFLSLVASFRCSASCKFLINIFS